MRERRPVEIALPLEVHYALSSHLRPLAPPVAAERVDAEGGAELIGRVATITGLKDLAKLRTAVRQARYRVRVTSPEPLLRLQPSSRRSASR